MNQANLQGLIVKLTGGSYEVRSDSGSMYRCRARGKFRYEDRSPLVGDMVSIETIGEDEGYIQEILPRKNSLTRPPVANVDRLALIVSTCDPKPNLFVLDQLIAVAEFKDIEPVLIVTKTDREDGRELTELYRGAGFSVFPVSNETNEGISELTAALREGITVFAGNTGVGKSSLLNSIDPKLELSVGETSRKLGRGRHTTRHVELFRFEFGGYIADTPGFSIVDLERYDAVRKEQLQYCFREFEQHLNSCKFTGCSHTGEKGCAVCAAVRDGVIAESRHSSYCALYREAQKIKDWER